MKLAFEWQEVGCLHSLGNVQSKLQQEVQVLGPEGQLQREGEREVDCGNTAPGLFSAALYQSTYYVVLQGVCMFQFLPTNYCIGSTHTHTNTPTHMHAHMRAQADTCIW